MRFVYNDGGRRAAGYKGHARDCVVRSIAIATQLPYQQVYDAINTCAKAERRTGGNRSSARNGVHKLTTKRFLESQGWKWYPTMQIGSGCTVHLADGELPIGRLIVSCSRHLTAIVNGVIHDTHDPRREGRRCVYGYWMKAVRVRYTNGIPKSIRDWCDAHADRVSEVVRGNPASDYWRYFAYTAKGWNQGDDAVHSVIGDTAKDFIAALKQIGPCSCEECVRED